MPIHPGGSLAGKLASDASSTSSVNGLLLTLWSEVSDSCPFARFFRLRSLITPSCRGIVVAMRTTRFAPRYSTLIRVSNGTPGSVALRFVGRWLGASMSTASAHTVPVRTRGHPGPVTDGTICRHGTACFEPHPTSCHLLSRGVRMGTSIKPYARSPSDRLGVIPRHLALRTWFDDNIGKTYVEASHGNEAHCSRCATMMSS